MAEAYALSPSADNDADDTSSSPEKADATTYTASGMRQRKAPDTAATKTPTRRSGRTGSKYRLQAVGPVSPATEAVLKAADASPPWLAKGLRVVAPVAGILAVILSHVAPYLVKGVALLDHWYQIAPRDLLTGLYGLAMCFFGGYFALGIAAVEAFHQTGSAKHVLKCVGDLRVEFGRLKKANSADNKVDDDNDGIPDVQQIDAKALAMRKLGLAMRVVNPDRVSKAFGGVYQGFIAMVAIMQLRFARTIALAMGIADVLHNTAHAHLEPTLVRLFPDAYSHWVEFAALYMCKCIALSVAWTIQRVISAVHSAIKGGAMAVGALAELAHERKMIKEVPPAATLALAGYALAAAGFFFQLTCGFKLPFPLNLILFPLRLLEWWLGWTISFLKFVN